MIDVTPNIPEVVTEVRDLFERYEQALTTRNVDGAGCHVLGQPLHHPLRVPRKWLRLRRDSPPIAWRGRPDRGSRSSAIRPEILTLGHDLRHREPRVQGARTRPDRPSEPDLGALPYQRMEGDRRPRLHDERGAARVGTKGGIIRKKKKKKKTHFAHRGEVRSMTSYLLPQRPAPRPRPGPAARRPRGGGRRRHDPGSLRRPIKPAGARVIDCGGRTLMPGLIDCHVHVYLSEVEDPQHGERPVDADDGARRPSDAQDARPRLHQRARHRRRRLGHQGGDRQGAVAGAAAVHCWPRHRAHGRP